MNKELLEEDKKTEPTVPKVPPNIIRLRFLVENYYDVQDNRIRLEGRNRSWRQQYKILGAEEAVYKENITEQMRAIEKWLEKRIRKEVKNHPLWAEWLINVKGIGAVLAGGIISWIGDIERFETVGALKSYSGYAVDEEGNAVKRRRGEKANWNPRLKKHLWKTTESFIKFNGLYREYYDRIKKRTEAQHPVVEFYNKDGNLVGTIVRKSQEEYNKEERKEIVRLKKKGVAKYTKLHIHNYTSRKVRILFLSHIWTVWRALEGLPLRLPYAVEYLGESHSTIIYPYADKPTSIIPIIEKKFKELKEQLKKGKI